MPKKQNILPNQRVDIVDYSRGANDYTQESVAFARQNLVQAKRSAVVDGFRVEIAEQTANPGQITVYNGVAVDRDGDILNNEEQVNTARTVTLSGASTIFYVEVEFVENESDTDARAFWDPTFVNTGNIPPGREFTINVATRITPDWQIVTPVSTTGFEVDTNPNSTKIPVAVLRTDGSNEITLAVNTGLTEVAASSKLEDDVASLATSIRLFNTRLFPDTGTITVDFGDTSAEAGVAYTANDRVNGILTLSAGLASAHESGAIVRLTGVTGRLVQERTSSISGSTVNPDFRRRLYGGDEFRGAGLIKSKETFNSRDDVDFGSSKDFNDAITALIREIKFGMPRPGDTNFTENLPPLSSADWLNNRYFERAGNLQSVRGYSITVGDAVNSLGDLNQTASGDLAATLQIAQDALDATRGGSILVKQGVYEWDSSLNIDRPVYIEFEEGVDITSSVATLINLGSGIRVSLNRFRVGSFTGNGERLLSCDGPNGPTLHLTDCDIGGVDFTNVSVADTTSITLDRCLLTGRNGSTILNFPETSILSNGTSNTLPVSSVTDCVFNQTVGTGFHLIGSLEGLYFDRCDFQNGQGFYTNAGASTLVSDLYFSRCKFYTESASTVSPLSFTIGLSSVVFSECDFSGVIVRGTDPEVILLGGTPILYNARIVDCVFENATSRFPDATEANPAAYVRVEGDPSEVIVDSCRFGDLTATRSTIFDSAVGVAAVELGPNTTVSRISVKGCKFGHLFRAIEVSGHYIVDLIDNQVFSDYSTSATRDDRGFLVAALTGSGEEHRTVTMHGNLIHMRYNDNGTEELAGIEIAGESATGPSGVEYRIVNNHISKVGGSGTATGTAHGILYTLSDLDQRVSILNNIIEEVSSDSGMARCVTITGDAPSVSHDQEVNLVGNVFRSFNGGDAFRRGCVSVTRDPSPIADSPFSLLVSSNHFEFESDGSTNAWTILRTRCPNTTITGNTFADSSQVASTLGDDAAIHVIGYEDVVISGNVIDFAATDATAGFGINLTAVNNPVDRVIVANNVINGSINMAGPAISVFEDGLDHLNIHGNLIRLSGSAAENDGIIVFGAGGAFTPPNYVNIVNNTIVEEVANTARSAISVTHGAAATNQIGGVVISNNNISGQDKGASTSAVIDIVGCDNVAVTGNSVFDWLASGTTSSIITVSACNDVTITGNALECGTTGGAVGTVSLLSCDRVIVTSNILGTTTRTGLIANTGSTNVITANNHL